MKKDKIIISVLSGLVIIFASILIYKCWEYKTKYELKITKQEYYEQLEQKLSIFFKMYYFENTIPEERTKEIITITLEDLEKDEYPTFDFKSYDGEKCDSKATYSLNILKENKYEKTIYYKCGKDSNYNTK